MSAKILGLLVVVVLKARNLPNRNVGKADPFVTLRIGSNASRTRTDKRGGQHPEWDEELRFTIYDEQSSKKMKIQVYDEDKREHDLIGDTIIELDKVLKECEWDEWFPLKYRNKDAGEVFLEMTFYITGGPAPTDYKPQAPQTAQAPQPPSLLTPQPPPKTTLTPQPPPKTTPSPPPPQAYNQHTAPYPSNTAPYPPNQPNVSPYPPTQPSQYQQPQSGYPPQTNQYPPPVTVTSYPPQNNNLTSPPANSPYPPPNTGYPPSNVYPPPSAGYPPQNSGYPTQNSGYPPPSTGYPPVTPQASTGPAYFSSPAPLHQSLPQSQATGPYPPSSYHNSVGSGYPPSGGYPPINSPPPQPASLQGAPVPLSGSAPPNQYGGYPPQGPNYPPNPGYPPVQPGNVYPPQQQYPPPNFGQAPNPH